MCQVSVLAMTSSPEGSRETLKYKLQGAQGDISKWGHEYVRHLAGQQQAVGSCSPLRSSIAPPPAQQRLLAHASAWLAPLRDLHWKGGGGQAAGCSQ